MNIFEALLMMNWVTQLERERTITQKPINQKDLTFGCRQSSPQQFHRHEVVQNPLLIGHCRVMTMPKGVVKVLFSQIILIFKHVESTNIVPICYHLTNCSIFMYASTFHWSERVRTGFNWVGISECGKNIFVIAWNENRIWYDTLYQ